MRIHPSQTRGPLWLYDDRNGCYKEGRSLDGGAVAQLGARLDGIEEVVGSNPIGSTIFRYVQPGDMGNRMYRSHG